MTPESRVTERVLSLRLPADLHDAVRQFANKRHLTIAGVLRWALSEHLERHEPSNGNEAPSRRVEAKRSKR